jgi:hypothetical protein
MEVLVKAMNAKQVVNFVTDAKPVYGVNELKLW